jgi:hypothetical protein
MPLFRRRAQERDKAAMAAAGTPVSFTTSFDSRTRTRLLYAIRDSAPSYFAQYGGTRSLSPAEGLLMVAQDTLVRDYGQFRLAGESVPHEDLLKFIFREATDEQVLDVIEAVFIALRRGAERSQQPYLPDGIGEFGREVNRIFDEDDIAYQVVDMEVVPRSSMAMHADVVAPAISLLHGDPRLVKVEKAFHDALRELKPGGSPPDAITDAATALQEILSVLGCRGHSLGPMLDDARKKGLLGPHDSNLALGVERIGDWVSADRSERGDAHHVTAADGDDAWLAVHVVGALLLRLERRL